MNLFENIQFIIFFFSFLAIIIKEFVPLKKGEVAAYKKYSKANWILFSITLILLFIGILKSINDDTKAKVRTALAEQKRRDDSTLLLKRWVYDTTKFKELLDSSEKIITNSLANIEKTNKNLVISDNLLQSANQQNKSLERNINLTNKLNYALPYSIDFKFYFNYLLDKDQDSDFIDYLDKLSIGKDSAFYIRPDGSVEMNSPGQYFFYYDSLNHQLRSPIDRIVNFLLGSDIEFVKEKDPILRLATNFYWSNDQNFKSYNDVFKYLDFVYDKNNKSVWVVTHKDFSFKTSQKRKIGITSLVDLEHSILFISTFSLKETAFDVKRIRLDLELVANGRSIYFERLIPLNPTKGDVAILKKYDIHSKGEPVFFLVDIKPETLRGFYKSLRHQDLYNRTK